MSSAAASQPKLAGVPRAGRGRVQVPAKKPRSANKATKRKKKALVLFEGPAPPPGLEGFCGELGYHEARTGNAKESAGMIAWLAEGASIGDLLLLWVVCPHGSGPTPEDAALLQGAVASGASVKIVEDRPALEGRSGDAGRFLTFGLAHGLADATPLCAGRAWPAPWGEEHKEADKLRGLVVEQVKKMLPLAPIVAARGPRRTMKYDADSAAWSELVEEQGEAAATQSAARPAEPQAWCLSAPEGLPGEFSLALVRLLRSRGGGRAREGMAWPTAAELLHKLRAQKCLAAESEDKTARLLAAREVSTPSALLMTSKPVILKTRLRFG